MNCLQYRRLAGISGTNENRRMLPFWNLPVQMFDASEVVDPKTTHKHVLRHLSAVSQQLRLLQNQFDRLFLVVGWVVVLGQQSTYLGAHSRSDGFLE